MAESLEVAQLYASIGIRGLEQTRGGINSLKSQMNGLKTILKSLVGFAVMKQIGGQFLEAAKSAESYRMSLRAVTSSVEVADAAFKRMRDWAAINPIDTDEAIGSYVRLTTAAVADAERATKVIANLATAMNVDMRDVAGAIVTTEVEVLRRLGIILDRTGKTAIMSFGRVTLETDKSIKSIRAGLINLIEQSVGTAMQQAANTFRGTIKTLLGMFDVFKQQVMGLDEGPFVRLTEALRGARDQLSAFMQTADYQTLVANLQSLASVIVDMAITGLGALATALKTAYEHANLLVAAFAAITAAKVVIAIAAIVSQLKKMAVVMATIKALQGPSGWLALAAAAVAGGVAYVKVTKAMEDNTAQATLNADAVDRMKEKYEGASAAVIRASYELATANVGMLTRELQMATTEAARLQGAIKEEIFNMSAKGKLLEQLEQVEQQITKITAALKMTRAEKNALFGMLKDSGTTTTPTPPPAPPKPAAIKTKEKTAAEKLVEKIRDQIKYMGVDGGHFTKTLEQWIAKSKVLSSDWKILVDLYREITAAGEEDIIMRAKAEKQRREDADAQIQATQQTVAASQSAWLAMKQWGLESGMVGKESYMAQIGAEFERLRVQLDLTMEDFEKWPPYMRELFMAIQSGVMDDVTPKLEILHEQFTNGTITLGAYKAALDAVLQQYGHIPLAVEAVKSATANATVSIVDFSGSIAASLVDATQSFNNLAITATEGVVDGFANAIAYSQSFGESLRKLGQDIMFTIVKMLALKAITKLFSGFADGGVVSGMSSLGTSSYGESYGSSFMDSLLENAKGNVFDRGGLAKFASGGIVDKPTLFKFAHGVGLMGEAGAEAIMPLQRGSDGKLGVRGSSSAPPVIINVQSHIHAMDAQSFVAFAQKNRKVFDSLMVASISANSSVRKVIKEMA